MTTSAFDTNPLNFQLDIIYEEGSVIAINKPAGILTQSPPGIDSLELHVKKYLIEKEQKTGKCYLGIPHRLDRPASGLIVFAKNSRAANRLSEQFESRMVQKKYWAIVSGMIEDDEGTWIDYMRKIPGRAEAEIRAPIHPDAREAVLHFFVKKRWNNQTWLEIELETGRTHQIRLQCGSRGFPLLGDQLYGSTVPFGTQFADDRLRSIALHSREMTFSHPQTREKIVLVAPISKTWESTGIFKD
ncbi:MAG: RNA pseudouridine synthase [Planctomycetia bacterium]|nr:RNA pseudouridine synthase [Planctomycetia bacterium]